MFVVIVVNEILADGKSHLHLFLDIVENYDAGDGINEFASRQQVEIRSAVASPIPWRGGEGYAVRPTDHKTLNYKGPEK